MYVAGDLPGTFLGSDMIVFSSASSGHGLLYFRFGDFMYNKNTPTATRHTSHNDSV